MTIDEAIRILIADKSDEVATEMEDIDSALQLGIEALKREQAQRNPRLFKIGYLLPGETKE